MLEHQQAFIELALAKEVLSFGEFTLKSGRISPYFFNLGKLSTGTALSELGEHYAKTIDQAGIPFDVIFGPAYKGIPLAAATAIAYAKLFGKEVPYCFNRKEAKDHGEGGQLVGPLYGRVLIIDDVVTAGTATREAITLIKKAGAQPVGLVVAFDRQERGSHSTSSAMEEIQNENNMKVCSIVNCLDLLNYTQNHQDFTQYADKITAYQAEYGANK